MKNTKRLLDILIAEDDPDDQLLIRDALEAAQVPHRVTFVEDGVELMEHLQRFSRPNLILLDLNMPRKDGRESLREIKSNPSFRRIPVIVFTTSDSQIDILKTYDLGGNAYVRKPETFQDLVNVMKTIDEHWCKVAEIPTR